MKYCCHWLILRAYYSIYEKVRREHPGLLFEICNDGGRMVDFGSAAHGDYFSITDSYDPLSNRRAFFDASHLLPAAMLESYIAQVPTPHLENFLYMLRSGMMGWITIMLDTTMWSAEQQQAARHAFALYKTALRPLIRDAQLYHVSERPDGVHWDGMEYWDPKLAKGVLFAFRGAGPEEAQHSFHFSGLCDEDRYRVHFEDGTGPDEVETGRQLRYQASCSSKIAAQFRISDCRESPIINGYRKPLNLEEPIVQSFQYLSQLPGRVYRGVNRRVNRHTTSRAAKLYSAII